MLALSEFIKTGKKGDNWEELFPTPEAAAPAKEKRPSSGGGGGEVSILPIPPEPPPKDYHVAGVTRAMTKPEMSQLAAKTQDAYTKAMLMRSLNQPFSSGGMVIPKRMNMGGGVKGYAAGGFSMGSDIVPAMLTPGEFVVRKRAVQNFGMDNMEKINNGSYADGSVYNYNLAVNVSSDSDPSRIARAVITQIKRVDSQRIRNNKL